MSQLQLTHATIINQSSQVLFFKIPKRLINLPATKIVARTNVVVVTMKTDWPRPSLGTAIGILLVNFCGVFQDI